MSSSPEFASGAVNPGSPATLINADTATDGTGVNTVIVFTAATSGKGSFLPKIRCKPLGTNVASLARVWRNNGSAPATASNNALIAEKALPAVTISQTAENAEVDIDLNIALKANATTPERILVAIATAVAGGWKFTPYNGGDF